MQNQYCVAKPQANHREFLLHLLMWDKIFAEDWFLVLIFLLPPFSSFFFFKFH